IADEEGGTPIVRCENAASIQKSNGLANSKKQMETLIKLPKDCYKVSIDKSLVDAVYKPNVENNGFKIVKDAATPPSTIKMIDENKTAPKLPTKRKNIYVSCDAMQKQARKKS
ncbi:hypothetical protein Tco_1324850, partial [Tanacetum coccineum]